MEQYIIKGGNPLVGEVEIGGAKNAALAILAAAIMTDETVHIENLPDVRDINVLLEAIKEIGATVDRIGPTEVKIAGATIGNITVEYEYIKKIRASYYLLGALLGKYKNAEVPLPGGCNIGSRPIDQHLKGFRALGASVDIIHGAVVAKAEHLTGKHIFMDMVSVGATINVMMAAAMAQGNTTIENAAREPHVVDVANFLNSMGANIKGAGTDVIRIQGVDKLHGTTYSIIPDQIEAGTFMCAAAATMGDIMVKNVIPKHLEATTAKLEEIGCQVEEFDDAVRVVANKRLKRTNVKTMPYPGYPTDMQPQFAVALTLAEGTSIVTESIFENRFKYADELTRMGANIKVEGNTAIIDGVQKLAGARVSAPDLRAGAALVIAGLAAEGITIVDDIVYIQRGYERFEEKLRSLGAEIEKVSSEKETQQEQEEKEVEKEESEPVKLEDAEPITEKFPDIKSYVESDLVQEQLDAQLSSLGDSGMSMEVLGEDNKLIYRYTMDGIVKTDALTEQLQSAMDGQADTFKNVASSLKLAVEVENPVVVVEYIDMNGEVILSAEYTTE